MDAFYASVEQRDDAQLRGKPVIVAWQGKRSVVCAASYEARAFGVHSAMPAMQAERLCPGAIFVAPDFTRYRAVSNSVREIFKRHTDLIEPLSLDEAYLDVTANKMGLPTATLVARTIREQIRKELNLTASAGVASNKFLAKLASDWRKPDGLFVIQPEEIDAFLLPLPVGRLPGVGKVTGERLANLGIKTVRDLRTLDLPVLELQYGRYGLRLHDLARALPRVDRRSIIVNANHGQPGRCATVAIGFSPVTIPAPRGRRGEHSDQPAEAFVIHVREIRDPQDHPAKSKAKGPEPLEWILLTNVPVQNAADAWERVDWYRCRPVIEEFHKAMKTGCGVELLQFTHRAALEVALALLSVVATQLLKMRDLSRDPEKKDLPATRVIDEIYAEVLSVMRFGKKQPLTAYEFSLALAYLGGHLNRRIDKPPGWLVLWRGWTKLQPMVSAVQADRRSRCV